jgi:hypothetical protein
MLLNSGVCARGYAAQQHFRITQNSCIAAKLTSVVAIEVIAIYLVFHANGVNVCPGK